MMKKILILIMALQWANQIVAQLDKDKFEKIFEEEVFDSKYSSRENHSSKYQHIVPQTFPAWFTSPPTSSDDVVYSIGISDPEMDSTEALNMAIYRAQVLANVLCKSTTMLLCDFFLNEKDNSSNIAYEHFTRISASIPLAGNFQVVESFRNSFDETLVLIKYFPAINLQPEETNRIKFELYKNEIQSTTYGNFESIYELWVQSNSSTLADPIFYQVTELGPRSDVMSAQENEQKRVPIYKLIYSGIPISDSVQYCNFTHGLWKEYCKSVMLFIINKAREKPENIRHISDIYQKNSFEKLTRGISVNKMRFTITGIDATKDLLKVHMQELQLQE